MIDYATFLDEKRAIAQPVGREIDPADIHPMLFPFQRAIVAWAALPRRDRASGGIPAKPYAMSGRQAVSDK